MLIPLFCITVYIFVNHCGGDDSIDLWIENTCFDENENIHYFKIRKKITSEQVEELTRKFHFRVTVRKDYTLLNCTRWTGPALRNFRA